eukprot:TRINITY_DN11111_c0_g1_i3.p1 TRINITY_DN11111_c0_g1~~TRINITY_DN11111_c0_g1_i3.p1  ORF type:complete len:754 (+),score=157.69 TRINITY_DN11111_c0_g1_i3:1-2262(+)
MTASLASSSGSSHQVGPAAQLPYCTLERVSQVYLHQLLRQLIRRNLGNHAWEIAKSCLDLPYFQHSLELLLHSVLEEEATSKEPIPDALLPSIVDFIRSFPVYRETVVRCTRKTEVALWPYLFAAVGSAKELFVECMSKDELTTAASYLIVLQSLEPASAAKQHATQLLDSALDKGNWDLAKDLSRFLRAIDPDECYEEVTSPRSVGAGGGGSGGGATGGVAMLPSFPSPMSPAQAGEEDLSLVLGTLVMPRSRSISTNTASAAVGKATAAAAVPEHQSLSRSVSERPQRLRKASSSSSPNTSKDGTAEEFFIDTIFARHARKLLSAGRLPDLGKFSAHLEFQLVSWLRREASRAAQLQDFVWAVTRIHEDLNWPWPSPSSTCSSIEFRSRTSSSHLSFSATDNPNYRCDKGQELEEKLGNLYVDCGDRPESGYMSTSTGRQVSEQSLLSEQAVDAMLRVRDRTEQLSVLSEDEDVGSICGNALSSPCIDMPPPPPPQPSQPPTPSSETGSDSPPRREVQLRYMLQILLEAGCLEWATAAAFVLQDAMAIIRIVNAARSSTNAQDIVERLHDGFIQFEECTHQSFHGYASFLNSIQPQIKTLYKFLNGSPKVSTSSLPFQHQQNSTAAAATPSNLTAHNNYQLKPPPAQKHTTPPVRPTLPRTLSDPIHAHAAVNSTAMTAEISAVSGVGGGGALNVTDGSSPPRLASTPLPQTAAVDVNNTTSYSDGEGEMRAAAERVEQELEDEQGACVIS